MLYALYMLASDTLLLGLWLISACERFPSMARAYCTHCNPTPKENIGVRVNTARETIKFGRVSTSAPVIPHTHTICAGCYNPTPWMDARYGVVVVSNRAGKVTSEYVRLHYTRATDSVGVETTTRARYIPDTRTGHICAVCRDIYQFTPKDEGRVVVGRPSNRVRGDKWADDAPMDDSNVVKRFGRYTE